MPFLRYLAGTPRYCLQMLRLSPTLASYGMRLMPNDIAKEKVLQHCLGGLDWAWLMSKSQHFGESVLPRLLRAEGMERLEWHRQQGHECVLVSASLDLYLRPWALQEGFSRCLSSSVIQHEDICTGQLSGANCYGPEKLNRIRQAYPDFEARTTYAYGDSAGDTAMLSACQQAFIWRRSKFREFNPDQH